MPAAAMTEAAVALRPKLMLRALELHGGHHADAEDLLHEVYVAFCRQPPAPRSPVQLLHWLRSVMLNLRRQEYRRRFGGDDEVTVASFDVMYGWTGGG
jgi:DNA-directed RNA polymerase specialized sigma24 family protein